MIRGASQARAHLFLVRDREDVRQLVGQPAGGWTEPDANAVLAAVSDAVSPPLRHELGHLYSHRLWGPPHAAWLSEGVAAFAVGHCAGYVQPPTTDSLTELEAAWHKELRRTPVPEDMPDFRGVVRCEHRAS